MERRQVRYQGRVQGVGFRARTRAIASGHAVTGWVRNEADGSVLLQAQGPALEAFLGEVARKMARNIDRTEVEPVEPVAGEVGFVIGPSGGRRDAGVV